MFEIRTLLSHREEEDPLNINIDIDVDVDINIYSNIDINGDINVIKEEDNIKRVHAYPLIYRKN